MTDNEIIKALDCFSGKEIYCKSCAYRDNSNMGICRRNAAKDTIDLINRQRAEISVKNKLLQKAEKLIETERAEAVKEFAERLEQSLERRYNAYGRLYVLRHIEKLVKEMVGEG